MNAADTSISAASERVQREHEAAQARRKRVIFERKLSKRSGSEGPQHDPYGWNEYTVDLNGHSYTLRIGGLGYNRLVIDGTQRAEGFAEHQSFYTVMETWQRLTGIEFEKFERWHDRAHPYDPYEDAYGPA